MSLIDPFGYKRFPGVLPSIESHLEVFSALGALLLLKNLVVTFLSSYVPRVVFDPYNRLSGDFA